MVALCFGKNVYIYLNRVGRGDGFFDRYSQQMLLGTWFQLGGGGGG